MGRKTMNTGQIRRRGWLSLVLSCLIFLPIGGVSNSVALAQTPDIIFFDDFNGRSLNPQWTIVDNDANSWDLAGDNYLVLVLAENKNRFCYTGTVPDRYEFVVKVVFPQPLQSASATMDSGTWEYFYIAIDNPEKKFISLRMTSNDNKDWFMFRKGVQGKVAYVEKYGEVSTQHTEHYLKIARDDEIHFTGSESYDGNSWYTIGDHFIPHFGGGKPCFSASANTNTGKAVKVDYVELKALPPPPPPHQ
jgi:hypothetical protein